MSHPRADPALAHPSPCCPPRTATAVPMSPGAQVPLPPRGCSPESPGSPAPVLAAARHFWGPLQGRHVIQLRACPGTEALPRPPPTPAQHEDRVPPPAPGTSFRTTVLLMATAPQTLLLQGQNAPSWGQTLLWSHILILPQYFSSGQVSRAQQERSQHLPWLQCSVSLQEP